jgi:hypothetical protein
MLLDGYGLYPGHARFLNIDMHGAHGARPEENRSSRTTAPPTPSTASCCGTWTTTAPAPPGAGLLHPFTDGVTDRVPTPTTCRLAPLPLPQLWARSCSAALRTYRLKELTTVACAALLACCCFSSLDSWTYTPAEEPSPSCSSEEFFFLSQKGQSWTPSSI